MTAAEAAELLDLIIAKAPALAAAGVRGRVELGAVAFSVQGAEPDVSPRAANDEPEPDPLVDPSTYGMHGPDAPRRIARRTRTPLVEPGQ